MQNEKHHDGYGLVKNEKENRTRRWLLKKPLVCFVFGSLNLKRTLINQKIFVIKTQLVDLLLIRTKNVELVDNEWTYTVQIDVSIST